MPLKWVLHWQPNAGTTVNSQIINEVTQCVESINGVKEGRWKATITFYKPILREASLTGEAARDFLGIALPEQPSKYYLIMRLQRIILEADSSIQTIMEKLQSYKSRVSLYFEGFHYQLGDFQLRVGKVIPTHSENLRGIVMELEYLPISSMEKARQVMEEFMDIWQQALAKRSLPGHFMHVEPNFSEYGLGDQYTSQHTAVQYAAIMAQLIATVQARRVIPKTAPRRVPKPEVKMYASLMVKTGRVTEESDAEKARDWLKRFSERSLHARPKVETKLAPTQTAFGGAYITLDCGSAAAASGMKVEKEYSWPWKPANDLDLLDENKATSMFFLQSQQYLPTIKQSTKADGPEATKSSGRPGSACNMQSFMLVYRSGAIKLKLGDSLFDVSSGMKCGFAQDVVVTNENEKGFGIISELNK
ncbi:mediator of RNA polymerase II transcription subunit 20a-like [Pyrus ussuriensis x Pyrus communis]|uniref:Mediator of RNA polymerase II transcription subunit 20 n=1 Tax=Pyrus ussuriensis x Pyrus communis TaxID=2448454 RepID=A0A5N5H5A9_9ROSA|nr:mediator of RNA polymerase II transcription subunit 20a-like [Pyrus ussuriensis x Pyrus communis]